LLLVVQRLFSILLIITQCYIFVNHIISALRNNAGIIHPTAEARWLSDSGDRNNAF